MLHIPDPIFHNDFWWNMYVSKVLIKTSKLRIHCISNSLKASQKSIKTNRLKSNGCRRNRMRALPFSWFPFAMPFIFAFTGWRCYNGGVRAFFRHDDWNFGFASLNIYLFPFSFWWCDFTANFKFKLLKWKSCLIVSDVICKVFCFDQFWEAGWARLETQAETS